MKYKYTKELLIEAINNSESWRNVCRLLEIKLSTGNQSFIKKKAEKLDIDFSHFKGKSYAKGKISTKRKNALDYCYNGSTNKSHFLKLRLIADNIKKAECEICGIKEWNNEPVVLELDHKDSNHINNELSNLQIICPNCHAQVTRNRRKKAH